MADIPVPARVRPAVQPAVPPGTGRAVVVGTLIGFVVVGLLCGGAALAFGASPAGAAAVAAFTGFWGGPGFGGMMGFVLHQSREQERPDR